MFLLFSVATTFPSFPQVTPVLWVLAGIVVTLGVVGLAAVITLRVRGGMCGDCFDQEDDDQHTSTGSPESITDPAAKVSTATTGNLLTVSLQGVKGPVLVTAEEMDDRNPDVIPHTTGEFNVLTFTLSLFMCIDVVVWLQQLKFKLVKKLFFFFL